MFAIVNSLTLNGIEAVPVRVEIDVANGLPVFDIVGLPSASVREAKERVRSAIKNSGFEFPLKRITVNLAPADLRKEGSHLDLAIALGILTASEQVKTPPDDSFWVGELSLDGSIKAVPGVLSIVLNLKSDYPGGRLIIPCGNAAEAALVEYGTQKASSLQEIVTSLQEDTPLPDVEPTLLPVDPAAYEEDFADIRGQNAAKRGLEVAVAGGHNVLLVGPPGSGKTMLARRIPSIMPEMTRDEILETTRIYSAAGLLRSDKPLISTRPYRAPHRNASAVSIIGGGRVPRPGEISLAQHGVLFLDEVTEFARDVLESLRQPLEDGVVTVARTHSTLTYPCNFMMVAACNPCPCGFHASEDYDCSCTPHQVTKYFNRISGPLMDRIDIQIEVARVKYEHLGDWCEGERSAEIRARIERARDVQRHRFARRNIKLNSQMKPRDIRKYCRLESDSEELLRSAYNRLNLSARGYDRILKVARTIADLDSCENIKEVHIAEAIQYRGIEIRYK